MYEKYTGLTPEEFTKIKAQYSKFLESVNDVNKEPISVFKPLSKKSLEDIALIRELSRGLQKKKEEDVLKTKQAKEEEPVPEPEKVPEPEEEPKTEGKKLNSIASLKN